MYIKIVKRSIERGYHLVMIGQYVTWQHQKLLMSNIKEGGCMEDWIPKNILKTTYTYSTTLSHHCWIQQSLCFLYVSDQLTPIELCLHNVELKRWLAWEVHYIQGYNSYHYECIEKQTCHTLNKLFIVDRKHKDLASPIQLGKWKGFVVLFKYVLQMKEILSSCFFGAIRLIDVVQIMHSLR